MYCAIGLNAFVPDPLGSVVLFRLFRLQTRVDRAQNTFIAHRQLPAWSMRTGSTGKSMGTVTCTVHSGQLRSAGSLNFCFAVTSRFSPSNRYHLSWLVSILHAWARTSSTSYCRTPSRFL